VLGRHAKAGVLVVALLALAVGGILLIRCYDRFYGPDTAPGTASGAPASRASAFEGTMPEGPCWKGLCRKGPCLRDDLDPYGLTVATYRSALRGVYEFAEHVVGYRGARSTSLLGTLPGIDRRRRESHGRTEAASQDPMPYHPVKPTIRKDFAKSLSRADAAPRPRQRSLLRY
jgi:hypothetical protein